MTSFAKKILLGIVTVVVIAGIFYFANNKKKDVTPENNPTELCFAKFTPANERGLSDKYILRMLLDNDKSQVTGELNFLPGEKDSKVGKFTGTVTPVDKVMMARTVDALWE